MVADLVCSHANVDLFDIAVGISQVQCHSK